MKIFQEILDYNKLVGTSSFEKTGSNFLQEIGIRTFINTSSPEELILHLDLSFGREQVSVIMVLGWDCPLITGCSAISHLRFIRKHFEPRQILREIKPFRFLLLGVGLLSVLLQLLFCPHSKSSRHGTTISCTSYSASSNISI